MPLLLAVVSVLLLLASFALFMWSVQPPYPYGGVLLPSAVAATIVSAALAVFALVRQRRCVPRKSWFVILAAAISCLGAVLTPLAAEEHGAFPEADRWCDAVAPGALGHWWLVCPERPQLGCGYAFNAALSGLSLEDIPDPEHTVLLFESDRGWNAAGGASLLPAKPRHGGKDHYGLVMAWSLHRTVKRGAGGYEALATEAGLTWEVEPNTAMGTREGGDD